MSYLERDLKIYRFYLLDLLNDLYFMIYKVVIVFFSLICSVHCTLRTIPN